MSDGDALDLRSYELLARAHGDPVFLVTRGRRALYLHSMSAGDREQIEQAARANGIGPVMLVRHPAADVLAPRDLVSMVARLTCGRPIAHDPVGGIALAARIAAFATLLRGQWGRRLRGVYFDGGRRALKIWIRPGTAQRGSIDDVRAAMQVAAAHALDQTVELTALTPAGALLAVDRRSRMALDRARLRSRFALRAASFAALLGLTAAPAYAQGASVEGTIGAGGGVIDGEGFGQGVGQLGVVGDRFYLQGEVSGLTSGEDISGVGGGGQLGFVDPDRLRAGVFGYTWKLEDFKGTKFGAYGELYLDSVSFRLEGGRIDGDLDDADTYGRAKISFYASDNTKIFAEGGTLDEGWGGGGVEHAFAAMPGLVAGVSGRVGNDEETAKLFVRWYFGSADRTSTLKSMDRSGLAEPLFSEYEMRRTVRKARAAGYGGDTGDDDE